MCVLISGVGERGIDLRSGEKWGEGERGGVKEKERSFRKGEEMAIWQHHQLQSPICAIFMHELDEKCKNGKCVDGMLLILVCFMACPMFHVLYIISYASPLSPTLFLFNHFSMCLLYWPPFNCS